jgi:hypothetical protein
MNTRKENAQNPYYSQQAKQAQQDIHTSSAQGQHEFMQQKEQERKEAEQTSGNAGVLNIPKLINNIFNH